MTAKRAPLHVAPVVAKIGPAVLNLDRIEETIDAFLLNYGEPKRVILILGDDHNMVSRCLTGPGEGIHQVLGLLEYAKLKILDEW